MKRSRKPRGGSSKPIQDAVVFLEQLHHQGIDTVSITGLTRSEARAFHRLMRQASRRLRQGPETPGQTPNKGRAH